MGNGMRADKLGGNGYVGGNLRDTFTYSYRGIPSARAGLSHVVDEISRTIGKLAIGYEPSDNLTEKNDHHRRLVLERSGHQIGYAFLQSGILRELMALSGVSLCFLEGFFRDSRPADIP